MSLARDRDEQHDDHDDDHDDGRDDHQGALLFLAALQLIGQQLLALSFLFPHLLAARAIAFFLRGHDFDRGRGLPREAIGKAHFVPRHDLAQRVERLAAGKALRGGDGVDGVAARADHDQRLAAVHTRPAQCIVFGLTGGANNDVFTHGRSPRSLDFIGNSDALASPDLREHCTACVGRASVARR